MNFANYGVNRSRAKSNFARTFKLIWVVQSLPRKFSYFLISESMLECLRSAPA